MNAFFEQQKACPVCGTKFTVTRVRSSACFVMHRDSDFRVKYRDIDPLLYSIWVCPNCQYANNDKEFNQDFTPNEFQRLVKGLPLLKSEEPDFAGERTVQSALRAVEMAIRTAMVRQAPAIVLAGYYLRCAWLYRELGKGEEEIKCLEKAKEQYQHSFERESGRYADRMSDARIMYLIGELNRRTGNNEEAIKWFSRTVMNQDIKKEPELNRLVRDQWETAREDFKKQAAGQTGSAPELIENSITAAGLEQTAAAAEPNLAELPKPVARGSKVKMYLSLYMDQVDWMKSLSNKVYDKHKITLEKEAVARAIIDAVMEKCSGLEDFKTEDELKNLISGKFIE